MKTNLKPFTLEQQTALARGEILSNDLCHRIKVGLGIEKQLIETKKNSYIASGPGPGKTFTVSRFIDQEKLSVVKIQGAASMNALVIQLATAVYLKPKGDIIVWVDDCDSIFLDKESLNVMKGALDEDRNLLVWNKNLTNQINIYMKSDSENDHIKGNALLTCQPPGSVGVEVPTDRIRFVITSNKLLIAPSLADLNKLTQVNEAAIRSRVNYADYDIDKEGMWGWMGYNLLGAKQVGKNLVLSKNQKVHLLDWMWNHWDRISDNSMRGVQDFGADMLNHPTDYPDHWESRLMKKPVNRK